MVGVAVCGGELFGVQRAHGNVGSSRDLEAFRRRRFYVLFIFQFILHIKTGPLLRWSFQAVKPLKCFVGQTSPTFDWHGSKQIEGVEGAFWV